MTDTQQRIKDMVSAEPILLFMKGTADFPQCGFSARAVQILTQAGVEFSTFNVLADEEVRQGIKDYAEWPTIPQLYVKGEFLGGCDIMIEMAADGSLAEELNKAKAA